MITNSDFFFDALCLSIYSDSAEDRLLLREVIDLYESNKKRYTQDYGSSLYITIMKDILEDMYDLSSDGDVASMLMKSSHNQDAMNNPSILTSIKTMITNRKKITEARMDNLKHKVRNWVLWSKTDVTARKMFGKLQKVPMNPDMKMQDVLLNEVLESSREISKNFEISAGAIDDTVDFIDMSNKDSVMKAVKSHKYTRENKNVFKMGLQGINDLFYPNGGLLRGEFAAFIASSHHYKSGMLMNVARWIATLNPIPVTSGKPAIVFISLENEIYENMNQWFREAYVNAFHAEPKNLTDDEIVEHVTNMYSRNGYSLLVYRKLGDLFGFNEYVALVEQLESEGYSVVAMILDYITLMKLNENSGVNPAKALQNLASSMANYNKHKLITTVTGLQLGTEADRLNDSGISYVVKRYGTSHLADCRGLLRELDFAAFLYNEENNQGFKFLTAAWKKHRYVPSIPKEFKYPAWRYLPSGIPDDLNDKNSVVHDIYAEVINDEEKGEEESVLNKD